MANDTARMPLRAELEALEAETFEIVDYVEVDLDEQMGNCTSTSSTSTSSTSSCGSTSSG